MFLIIMWREARERPDRSLCYKSLTLSCPIIHTTLRETLCKHTHTPETHILSPTTTTASVPPTLPGFIAAHCMATTVVIGTIIYINNNNKYIYLYQCCQLNAFLTALKQTNFNGVNFFIARLTQLLFFSFFFLCLKTKKQQPDCYVHRLIALQAFFLYRPVLISISQCCYQ